MRASWLSIKLSRSVSCSIVSIFCFVFLANISFNFFLNFRICSAAILISVACPWAPPRGWWIITSAFGKIKRFPFSPEESKNAENTQTVQEKNVKTLAKKENNKTTTTSKQQTTQEKTPSQPQKSEQSSKSEQTTTPVKNNDSSYKEQEVQIAPKTECKGNNHKIGAGNTGKWFETQEQAAAYFKTEIARWGKQWENFEITDEEYHKNCPYGYEVWTCPQCQKWTVNFYYNK